MIRKIYAVYDVKAELYNTPFFMITNGEALRAFKDLANNKDTVVGRHPGDFKLMCIGVFDDGTGNVLGADKPDSLGFAEDFIDVKISLKAV